MRLFFLTHSLIGSINDRIFVLINQQVVLMGLTCGEYLVHFIISDEKYDFFF